MSLGHWWGAKAGPHPVWPHPAAARAGPGLSPCDQLPAWCVLPLGGARAKARAKRGCWGGARRGQEASATLSCPPPNGTNQMARPRLRSEPGCWTHSQVAPTSGSTCGDQGQRLCWTGKPSLPTQILLGPQSQPAPGPHQHQLEGQGEKETRAHVPPPSLGWRRGPGSGPHRSLSLPCSLSQLGPPLPQLWAIPATAVSTDGSPLYTGAPGTAPPQPRQQTPSAKPLAAQPAPGPRLSSSRTTRAPKTLCHQRAWQAHKHEGHSLPTAAPFTKAKPGNSRRVDKGTGAQRITTSHVPTRTRVRRALLGRGGCQGRAWHSFCEDARVWVRKPLSQSHCQNILEARTPANFLLSIPRLHVLVFL